MKAMDVGIWGPIIYGGVFSGLFLTLLGGVLYFYISRKRWAKRQANLMLDSGQVNPETIDKALRILGGRSRDRECQSLFRRLYNLVDKA